MNKKKWWILTGILISIFIIYKFKQERGIDRNLVRQKVDEIVQFEKNEIEKKCKQDALRIASKTVDSLLQIWGEQSSFDTTGRPGLPIKPNEPIFTSPLDKVPLKPLFDTNAIRK